MAAKNEPKGEKSLSRAGFAESVGAIRIHSDFRVLPSHMLARHVDNHDRAPMYSLAAELPELAGHSAFGPPDDTESDRFCFSRADVMTRAASFRRCGQEQHIRVARTNTGLCKVTAGYLRHAAALFLEVGGELSACSDMRDGLKCYAIDQAKTAEQQVEAVLHSAAENERKETSPVDFAWKCKRLAALQMSRPQIAESLGVSQSYVDKTLRLLTLPVATQLAVHEGRVKMTKALADASATGEGTARGPDKGVRKSAIMRALSSAPAERPQPRAGLTAKQVAELVSALVGAVDVDRTSDPVQEWIGWLDAPKPERQPKPESAEQAPKPVPEDGVRRDSKGRKAPPRAGKRSEVEA